MTSFQVGVMSSGTVGQVSWGTTAPCKGATAKRIPKMVRASLSSHLEESCFPRNEWAPHPSPNVHMMRIRTQLPSPWVGDPALPSPCPLDKRKQTQERTVLALGRHAGHRGHSRPGAEWGPAVLRQGAGHWGVEGDRDIVKHIQ